MNDETSVWPSAARRSAFSGCASTAAARCGRPIGLPPRDGQPAPRARRHSRALEQAGHALRARLAVRARPVQALEQALVAVVDAVAEHVEVLVAGVDGEISVAGNRAIRSRRRPRAPPRRHRRCRGRSARAARRRPRRRVRRGRRLQSAVGMAGVRLQVDPAHRPRGAGVGPAPGAPAGVLREGVARGCVLVATRGSYAGGGAPTPCYTNFPSARGRVMLHCAGVPVGSRAPRSAFCVRWMTLPATNHDIHAGTAA